MYYDVNNINIIGVLISLDSRYTNSKPNMTKPSPNPNTNYNLDTNPYACNKYKNSVCVRILGCWNIGFAHGTIRLNYCGSNGHVDCVSLHVNKETE